MNYKTPKINYVSFGDIGAVSPEGFRFVDVYISFSKDESGAHPSMKIYVPVKCDSSWSVERIHEAALEKAKGVMRGASDSISPLNAQQLEQLKADLLAIEEKQLSEGTEIFSKLTD